MPQNPELLSTPRKQLNVKSQEAIDESPEVIPQPNASLATTLRPRHRPPNVRIPRDVVAWMTHVDWTCPEKKWETHLDPNADLTPYCWLCSPQFAMNKTMFGPILGPYQFQDSTGVRPMWFHHACFVTAPAVCSLGDGTYFNVHKAIAYGSHRNCDVCKQRGAVLGCVVRTCRKVCHYGCGILSGWRRSRESHEEQYLCDKHAWKPKKDSRMWEGAHMSGPVTIRRSKKRRLENGESASGEGEEEENTEAEEEDEAEEEEESSE